MTPGEEDTDENLTTVRKNNKFKEEILDEAFKKAEISKKNPQLKSTEKSITKRLFPVSGIIFIIIAIVAIYFILTLPWMYVKYDINGTETDGFFYKDFRIDEKGQEPIYALFGSACNNCSNSSHNYLGLSIDDFTDTPNTVMYGFIILIILGLCFTIFAVIDKFRDYSIEKVYLTFSAIALLEFVVAIIILSLCVKFIAAYFLLTYNASFIESLGPANVKVVFLTPILLVAIASIILKGAMTVIKIYFKEIEKKAEADRSQKTISNYRYGSNL